ncbi:MAG TPA: glycosyltransferase family 2 protein [Candidatus Sulfotelmatobacter sp.]|nr:glycosyltransferase family 2 protein [Candidatus Sulfotelmatobacter sp.]
MSQRQARGAEVNPDPELSVIVVSWNTRELLRACLEALEAGRATLRTETIVVDNGSEDGSPDLVRERFPRVQLIANPDNRGFAAANNQALAQTHGRYVLLLNSDAEVEPEALARLTRYADEHPEVGILGPKLLYPDGRLQPSGGPLPTPLWTIAGLLGLSGLLGRPRYGTLRDYGRPAEVEEVSGAAMLVRREVIDRIGRLDEGFTWGYEDVDFCLRARRAGWRVHYVPDARVRHHWGGSSRLAPAATTLRAIAGRQRYFRKHYGRGAAALVMAGTAVSHGLRLIAFGALAVGSRVARGRARTEWQILQQLPRTGR